VACASGFLDIFADLAMMGTRQKNMNMVATACKQAFGCQKSPTSAEPIVGWGLSAVRL